MENKSVVTKFFTVNRDTKTVIETGRNTEDDHVPVTYSTVLNDTEAEYVSGELDTESIVFSC